MSEVANKGHEASEGADGNQYFGRIGSSESGGNFCEGEWQYAVFDAVYVESDHQAKNQNQQWKDRSPCAIGGVVDRLGLRFLNGIVIGPPELRLLHGTNIPVVSDDHRQQNQGKPTIEI